MVVEFLERMKRSRELFHLSRSCSRVHHYAIARSIAYKRAKYVRLVRRFGTFATPTLRRTGFLAATHVHERGPDRSLLRTHIYDAIRLTNSRRQSRSTIFDDTRITQSFYESRRKPAQNKHLVDYTR